jgi:hypothetical protein
MRLDWGGRAARQDGGMAFRHRLTAVAALAAMLALPGQPAAQDLFGGFRGSDAAAPKRPAAGYAVSRPGPASGASFFSPFGGLFRPFQPPPRPEPENPGAYRTLCVRMCDGYYFPISHATGSANLTRDAERCSAACGGDARLFYHANPGGDVETMLDLTGRAYASYPTAFRYRRTLVQGCQCRPQPWTQAEMARHRAYAAAEMASGAQPAPPATGAAAQPGAGSQADSSAAAWHTGRQELEAKGAAAVAAAPAPPRARARLKPAQAQGWDWLFGSTSQASPAKAARSSYAWSGAR